MPQISVIVPVYKVEQYLDRCVESVLAQTFTDFELILVDDGSPDNCPQMCDQWANKDCRITVIHKQNGGLSDARNAGIDLAMTNSNSQWITFLDSDDWLPVRSLQLMIDAAVSLDSDVVIGGISKNESVEISTKQSYSLNFSELYSVEHYAINVIMAPGKLYRKFYWNDVRFPIGKLHEDRFTTHKVLFKCKNIAIVEQPVYYYFQRDESITRSKWTPKRLDDIEAIKQQLLFFKEHNLPEAKLRVIKDHIYVLDTMIKELEDASPEYFIYKMKLRFKLKVLLIKYKKSLDLTFEKSLVLYEVAFPWIMKFYWNIKVLKRKIKESLNCSK